MSVNKMSRAHVSLLIFARSSCTLRVCAYEWEGEGGTRDNDNVKKVRATEAGDPDERERTRLWLCVQPQLITLCACTFVRVYVCSCVFV